MHDATEGGILGAIWEVAECSNVGVEVYADEIPVLECTKELCRAAGINYLRLISSGTMIITAFDGELMVKKLKDSGVNAAVIGRITEKEDMLHKMKLGMSLFLRKKMKYTE